MERELYAYCGKILRVDLNQRNSSIDPTMKYVRGWLGQRGIGQRILYEELKPWVTAYEPANKITVETGPLTGTLVPGSSRFSMASKNPFNGGVGTSSCGGFFGPELKFAGYDLIVIEGKARMPSYLWIDDDRIKIKDATRFWGKTTGETQDLIREELGDERIRVACIGPAGENLVRGACVISGNRAAGKCGMGGILGSKNLKAIAVRGSGSVEVAQPQRFIKAVQEAFEREERSEILATLSKYGTISAMQGKNECNSMGYRNFQDTQIPKRAYEKLTPSVFIDSYCVKDLACMSCPIHCSKFYHIDHGPYAGLSTEGFHLNTLADYAGKCAIDYPPAIVKVHALCNQLGIDLDASAGAISWALECYERGIVDEKDTDGLKLDWGDHGVILELIRKIAYREGFGNILAEGCKKAADIIGRESGYYAIHAKGQDMYEEIRSPLAWGLGTCVATRGGGHTTGAPAVELRMALNSKIAQIGKKVFGITNTDPISYEDKAKLVLYFEREQELINSLGICMFHGTWQDPEQLGIPELCELYCAATGFQVTEAEIVKIADRILNLEKAFNVLHANFTRQDDFPPERFLKEEIKSGRYGGFALTEDVWNRMLDDYYRLHCWDPMTGFQTRKCLEDLDLTDVADDLEKSSKLATV